MRGDGAWSRMAAIGLMTAFGPKRTLRKGLSRAAAVQAVRVPPAMAARLTERLWDIGDIVNLIEEWENKIA